MRITTNYTRMNSMRKQLAKNAVSVLFFLSLQFAGAAEPAGESSPAQTFLADDLFAGGKWEAGLGTGVLFSPFGANRNRPTINYTISELELGYMLGDVRELGWVRGNFELAGSGFGGAIFDGPGSYIAGGTLWLRYNFVPRDWRIVPFAQAGAGITFAETERRVLGQTFNFNLDVGVGARYLFDKHWSLDLEYRYQHISNANLSGHNLGINANGPILGISYFF